VYWLKVSTLSFLSCPLSPLLDTLPPLFWAAFRPCPCVPPPPSPAHRGTLLSAAAGVLSFIGITPSSLYILNLDAFFKLDG